MTKFLVLVFGGAGGDLPPALALGLGLRDRGHPIRFLADSGAARTLEPLGLPVEALPHETDIGPRIAAAVREAAALDPAEQGRHVERRLRAWEEEVLLHVRPALERSAPEVVLTSLFGVGVAAAAAGGRPWCGVNSTFYLDPDTIEADCAPRSVPILRYYASVLEGAPLALHATDPVFDRRPRGLPPHHHYTGPLIWDPPDPVPAYVTEDGDPWALVTISSQLQDDLPLARAALDALADQPMRVLATVGPDHDPDELGPLPANAHAERIVRHGAVLPRARLLVSHAGHGSVMKALWYGIPMVLIPWGRDQPGVAARTGALGAARVVARQELGAGTLAEAIADVLQEPRYAEEARRHSARMRARDPVSEACRHVERLR